LIQEVEKNMDTYDIPNAVKPILPFIDDASNWFVRRSRRRFWKSDDDADKENAYKTLHYVLVRLSQVMAPFVPFLSEELYRNLTGEESVHLTDWPQAGYVNELVVQDMETVRDYVNQALSLRAAAKLKIRQPLASVTVPTLGQFVSFEDVLTEELNVKKVIQGDVLALDLELTPALKAEGMMREVVRHIQSARKAAGLNVDDRIVLSLVAEGAVQAAITEHATTIGEEVLATHLSYDVATELLTEEGSYTNAVSIDGDSLTITLHKA